jgi:hypothetical protein
MNNRVLPFPKTPPDVADLAYRNALADLRRSYPEMCWGKLETVLQSYATLITSMYENERGAA